MNKRIVVMNAVLGIGSIFTASAVWKMGEGLKKYGEEVGQKIERHGKHVGTELGKEGKGLAKRVSGAAKKGKSAAIKEGTKPKVQIQKARKDAARNMRVNNKPIIRALLNNDLAQVQALVDGGVVDVNELFQLEVGRFPDGSRHFESVPLLYFAEKDAIVDYLKSKGARYGKIESHMRMPMQ